MVEALVRAACLAVLLLAAANLPWWITWPLVLALFGAAMLENRTYRHRIAGSSVLVTGASSGLGRALAVESARRGARLVLLVARDHERLQQTAEAIAAINARCQTAVLPCDLRDPEAIAALHVQVLAEHGAPDVLINNAGAGAWQHIEEGSAKDALDHLAAPYLCAVWLCQKFVPDMAARGTGHVLNITSAASLGGFRAANTYGSARWAVRGLSQYLRADLDELGIGVTLLNAAEIEGTAYFAESNAGSQSRGRIPWLFLHPVVHTLTAGDTTTNANAALDGVERGTHEVLYPAPVMVPFKLMADLFPEALHHLLRYGPNGRRKP